MKTAIQPITYWALAGHYTIGEGFVTREAALKEAALKLSRLQRDNDVNGRFNYLSVSVDERVKDHTGDKPVRRFTLTLEVK